MSGVKTLEDDDRCGRMATTVTPENVSRVESLTEKDPKMALWLALSWLCRVGVSGCELEFTVIDVSSGSLGRRHGKGRRE